MAYIDQNFVYSKIRIYADACYVTGNNKVAKIAERIEQLVREIPAADVRPVVRGKWIEHDEPYSPDGELVEAQYWYECSICGRWEYEKEPFCNCGAMMEEADGT